MIVMIVMIVMMILMIYQVSYSLSPDTPAPARPYFSVAPDSGEVKVAQPLEEADTPLLPLRLVVSALCTVSCTVRYCTHIGQ